MLREVEKTLPFHLLELCDNLDYNLRRTVDRQVKRNISRVTPIHMCLCKCVSEREFMIKGKTTTFKLKGQINQTKINDIKIYLSFLTILSLYLKNHKINMNNLRSEYFFPDFELRDGTSKKPIHCQCKRTRQDSGSDFGQTVEPNYFCTV